MEAGHRALLAALLASMTILGAAPLASAGGHNALYVLTTEHDDGGRSVEPDFPGITSVLGIAVSERDVDANLDGVAETHDVGRDVAPGCTDDSGRRPSGLCFLHWRTGQLGLPQVGVPGMTGNSAPGGFTPTKAGVVRFMDLQVYLDPLRALVDVNRKLDDSNLRPLLRQADPNFGNQIAPPSAGFHMWYGNWQDKNGNGVLDADGNALTTAEQARNEWQWLGQCKTFTGGDSAVPDWVCHIQLPSDIYVWAYPGNHHASTNGGVALFSPADVPGQQLLCFAYVASGAASQLGAGAIGCPARIQDIDDNDARLDIGDGDPFFGPQGGLTPDFTMAHRTGDPNPNTRHLVAGLGWAVYHYDQSLLVSYTTIAAENPPADPGSPRQFNPAAAAFVDVDRYGTFSPAAEQFLQVTLKPALRSNWVFVRDRYIPINNFVDGRVNSGATGLGALNGPSGTVDDALLNPGWGHEPNHALDVYPFVARGSPTHDGSTNSYAGYQGASAAGIPHLWADGQVFRTTPLIRPNMPAGLPSPPLAAGPFIIDAFSPAAPPRNAPSNNPADHSRSLGPGAYDFLGGIGAWRDRAHVNTEEVFNPLTLGTDVNVYVSAPDGWVANVINSTGQFRYRDYQPQACVVNGAPGTYERAQCDPYAGGAIQDPNDYGTDDGELEFGCGSVGSNVGTLQYIPAGGTWSVPVFVYRNFEELTVGDTSQIEDFTGKSGPINVRISCAQDTLVSARDYVFLPSGNAGLGVFTRWVASSTHVPGETVVDVDYYAPLA